MYPRERAMDIIDRIGINGEFFTVWKHRSGGNTLYACTQDLADGTAVEPAQCILTAPGIAIRQMRDENPNCRRAVTPQVV